MAANPEGHTPRYWRKHPKAAQNQPAIPVAMSESPQLNKSDTWTILGVLLGLLFVIIVPPLYAKVPIFVGVCVGLGWLAFRSHWVIGWNVYQKTCLGTLVIILCSAIAIPQFGSQWRSRRDTPAPVISSSPAPAVPSLEWRPLAITAGMGSRTQLNYNGKTPDDLVLTLEGSIVNSGAPSTTFDWEAKLLLPDDTVPILGYLLVSPSNPDMNWTLRTPDGHKASIPFREGNLPQVTALKAIKQGDTPTGFAIFAFHHLKEKWLKPRALNGSRVTMSFYDIAKRQTIYEWTLPDQHGQYTNDTTSEITPGMPTPH